MNTQADRLRILFAQSRIKIPKHEKGNELQLLQDVMSGKLRDQDNIRRAQDIIGISQTLRNPESIRKWGTRSQKAAEEWLKQQNAKTKIYTGTNGIPITVDVGVPQPSYLPPSFSPVANSLYGDNGTLVNLSNLWPYGYGSNDDIMIQRMNESKQYMDPRTYVANKMMEATRNGLDLNTLEGKTQMDKIVKDAIQYIKTAPEFAASKNSEGWNALNNWTGHMKSTTGLKIEPGAELYKRYLQSYAPAADATAFYLGKEVKNSAWRRATEYDEAFPMFKHRKSYTFADPEMREKMQQYCRAYLNNNSNARTQEIDGKTYKINANGKKIAHLANTENGKYWIYNVTHDPFEFMGDFSIITDENGNNARWVDSWNFISNDSGGIASDIGNTMYQGDIIPEGNWRTTNIQVNSKDNDDKHDKIRLRNYAYSKILPKQLQKYFIQN